MDRKAQDNFDAIIEERSSEDDDQTLSMKIGDDSRHSLEDAGELLKTSKFDSQARSYVKKDKF
jgi:hypothetical protein